MEAARLFDLLLEAIERVYQRLAVFLLSFLGYTGFYWVLPGFTEFGSLFTDFTRFYRVLPSFTEFSSLFIEFYYIILGFTGFYRVLPSLVVYLLNFTRLYWVLPSFTEFGIPFNELTRFLLGFTGFYRVLPGYTEFYLVLPSKAVFLVEREDQFGCSRFFSLVCLLVLAKKKKHTPQVSGTSANEAPPIRKYGGNVWRCR